MVKKEQGMVCSCLLRSMSLINVEACMSDLLHARRVDISGHWKQTYMST